MARGGVGWCACGALAALLACGASGGTGGTAGSGGNVGGGGGGDGGGATPPSTSGGASDGGSTTTAPSGSSSSGSPPAGDAGAGPGQAPGSGPAETSSDAASPADAGAPGDGDGGVAAACPGVPIVADDGGFVAPQSNAVGIHGSWFVYSDCTDLHGQNCSTVTAPPMNSFPNVGGKMCTSGHTSTATGAWGAGIALELNDGPPQEPYDTVANGVKGFCFVLSGATIPSTSIRVAFPTQDNNDNAYFSAVTTPGPHTVLFSDTAQGSWVTATSAFEPTKVMLIQFQIPSATTAPVDWDFCVEGLTAITQ